MTNTGWREAVERTRPLMQRWHDTGRTWDSVGVGRIVAVTVWALESDGDVAPWTRVAYHLGNPDVLRDLVQPLLGTAGEPTEEPAAVDPWDDAELGPAQVWTWLTRTWEHPGDGPRWDGLPRGIARGLTDPAVDVLTGWALGLVLDEVRTELGLLADHVRVTLFGGPHDGSYGYVRGVQWLVDHDAREVIGADCYTVVVTAADGRPQTVEVPVDQVMPAPDRQTLAQACGAVGFTMAGYHRSHDVGPGVWAPLGHDDQALDHAAALVGVMLAAAVYLAAVEDGAADDDPDAVATVDLADVTLALTSGIAHPTTPPWPATVQVLAAEAELAPRPQRSGWESAAAAVLADLAHLAGTDARHGTGRGGIARIWAHVPGIRHPAT